MNAPPEWQEKAPMGASTLRGAKKRTGMLTNGPTLQNAGRKVKPWAWGWPAWVSWLYVNGKGVRK
jgi:hypothetical protein